MQRVGGAVVDWWVTGACYGGGSFVTTTLTKLIGSVADLTCHTCVGFSPPEQCEPLVKRNFGE